MSEKDEGRTPAFAEPELKLRRGVIQCRSCRHLRPYTGRWTCDAFPSGIPWQIWLGNHDHTAPYPGDNGIGYERRRKADEEEEALETIAKALDGIIPEGDG